MTRPVVVTAPWFGQFCVVGLSHTVVERTTRDNRPCSEAVLCLTIG